MTTGLDKPIPNVTGRTKYHNTLLLSEVKEAFPDCLEIVEREIKRLESGLKIYAREIKRIQNSTLIIEHQDFLILVLKEMYMKTDKRFKILSQLKALQQVMRHEKFGISQEDIERARMVDIWGLYDFKKSNGKTACCPFHDEDNPSFSIKKYRGVQSWICFSCLKKGSGAIDFVMEKEGMKFFEAVKYLLNRQ